MTAKEIAERIYALENEPDFGELLRLIEEHDRGIAAAEQWSLLLILGAREGETLHAWIARTQDECNRLRCDAVAADRAACLKAVDDLYERGPGRGAVPWQQAWRSGVQDAHAAIRAAAAAGEGAGS